MYPQFSLKTGTASGAFLSMVPNVFSEDLLRTAILAVVGTVVSFTVTVLLKWLTREKKQ